MNEVNETSTSDVDVAADTTQSEVQQQVAVAESQSEVPHDLSIDAMTPDQLAEMFGRDELSQQIADKLSGEDSNAEAVRNEAKEQTEESTEQEETSEVESAETEAESNTDDETVNPEKVVYDIKQLQDEGIVLSMKVDGEFKEFDMDAIQRFAGQADVADEKSRKAAEDRQQAELAIVNLNNQRTQMQLESQVRSADAHLGSLAAEIQQMDAQIAQYRQEGNRYEAQELRDAREEKFQQYTQMYNGAQQLVINAKNNHFAAQRAKMEQMGGNAAKFMTDAEYRNGVKDFIETRNLNPQAKEAIANDADLLSTVIALYEITNATKPKARKKKPLTQHLRNKATSSNKPAAPQTKLAERLATGDMTLTELADNKGLLS